ncbi:MAG: sortase [Frankiaceae bacterium]|nr:sortase [Frankiaceae bacterium]
MAPRRRARERVRRRRGRLAPVELAVTAGCCGVALLAGWVALFALVLSGLAENSAQARLYATLRAELAGVSAAPLGGVIRAGDPVALLDAPTAGIRGLVVVEGTGARQLDLGPGHRPDTPLPGQIGWSVIDGRSVTFGGPFGHLTRLSTGDELTVTTGEGSFHYRIVGERQAGDPVKAHGPGMLTLTTSIGAGWRSGWAPDHAVYVDAVLLGQPAPTPPGRPNTVPAADREMAGDSSALTPLVLWLELCVVAIGGTAWAFRKWGLWQGWLVGVPLALTGLWGASMTATQLLPNLI